MTFEKLWEQHRTRRQGLAGFKDEESAFRGFVKSLGKPLTDPVGDTFGAGFDALIRAFRETLAARELAPSTIDTKCSRLAQIRQTWLLGSWCEDGFPREFSQALKAAMELRKVGPTGLAKRVYAREPSLGAPGKSPCFCYQPIVGLIKSWMKTTPDIRSPLHLVSHIEAELGIPGLLQTRLPHAKKAQEYDPAFAEKAPDGLPAKLGMRIRHFRWLKGISIAQLEQAVGTHGWIGRIEIGLQQFPDFRRALVAQIDRALDANGAILRRFDEAPPSYHNDAAKRCTQTKRLKYYYWNDRLESEFCGLRDFKTDMTREREYRPGVRDIWEKESTINEARHTIGCYLGYLRLPAAHPEGNRSLQGKGIAEGSLSLALVADPDLIKSFVGFLRLRAGETYSARIEHVLRLLVSLLREDHGYVRLHPEKFAGHPHFKGKLPQSVEAKIFGVKTVKLKLTDVKDRWAAQCQKAQAVCQSTLNNLKLKRGGDNTKGEYADGRIKDQLLEENPYRLLLRGKEILGAIEPPRSTQPVRWAVFVRNRLLFEILAIDPLRSATLVALQYPDHVSPGKDGQWLAHACPGVTKNGRRWEGPIHPLLSGMMSLYVNEARPILMARSQAPKPSPYLFVSPAGENESLQMTTEAVYQALLTLAKQHLRDLFPNGLSGKSFRKIVATQIFNSEAPSTNGRKKQSAAALRDTEESVRYYARANEAAITRQHNALMGRIIEGLS